MNRTWRSTRIPGMENIDVNGDTPLPVGQSLMMNDVFLVIGEARNGKRSARCVLAGDELDARLTHQENHPDDHIIAVKAHG
jgi:hypothetical protein